LELPIKEELERLYLKEKLSTREIGLEFNISGDKVLSLLREFNIKVRNTSEAIRARYEREREVKSKLAREEFKIILKDLKGAEFNVKYSFKERDNLFVPLPLSLLKKTKNPKKEITLAVVISDLHLGDCNHLPNTYWSCISNLINIIKTLDSKFKLKDIKLVLNGDIVSGREVYRMQEIRNMLSRGHWQVFLAEIIIKETLEMLTNLFTISSVYLVKGTHESLAENYILYLKRVLGKNIKYLGHSGIVNIANPIGKYNIFFTHGFGSNSFYPISNELLKDIWKANSQHKLAGVPIERFCLAHSHWLTTNLELEGMLVDVTGGFQKWERSISQRPSGLILYLYYDGEVTAIPIRPDKKVETKELSEAGLEYKNLKYYGEKLLKHLKEIENIE